jgi:hypothetical protein
MHTLSLAKEIKEVEILPDGTMTLSTDAVVEASPRRDRLVCEAVSSGTAAGDWAETTSAAHWSICSFLVRACRGPTVGFQFASFLIRPAASIMAPHCAFSCFFSLGSEDNFSAFMRFSAALIASVSASSLLVADCSCERYFCSTCKSGAASRHHSLRRSCLKA